MKNFYWITRSCAVALVLAFTGSPGYAAAEVTGADLQAVAQTLGFLTNLPNAGVINIGIVYAQDQAGSEARAGQAATQLNAMRGPNQRTLHGTSLAVKDLGRTAQFDAYLLMPGTPSQSAAINEAVRRHHTVSISTDPACLDANCCVLMVSAQGRVRIVLDTALADAAGAQFSSVFAMMVTRK